MTDLTRSARPRSRGLLPPALLCLLAVSALAREVAAAAYAQGERVRITGIVTDARGTPLNNVQVAFVASRSVFRLRQLKSSDKDERRVTAVTGAKGEYALDWAWDSYYNHFEVQVGFPVRQGRSEHIEVLAQQDISQALLKGNPVVPALVVENAALIEKVRQFLASLTTDDLRRVYQEMGNPDQVQKVEYPDHEEVSWWYFESGTVYRFESGRLAETRHFTPVKPF
ncbi:MAG TPA: hypothetical protein VMM92_05150 [Thermoanaerobaculia bacterium]|nr:hypothetical protein [Thermoanaerobaculia bacterium]